MCAENYKNRAFEIQNMKNQENSNKQKNSAKSKKLLTTTADTIRLNKFIASAGICTRREADTLIKDGKITVNGIIATELGAKISNSDVVFYKGKKLIPGKKVYILFNKPKDCDASFIKSDSTKTAMDYIKHKGDEQLFPVAPLDNDYTGLQLITNDADLAEKLNQQDYNKLDIYHIFLNKDLSEEHLKEIEQGLELHGKVVKPKTISFVESSGKDQIGIEIRSMDPKMVAALFEFLDYKIIKLDRVYYAGLTKKRLQRGFWRYLTEIEISVLSKGAYK